jgi:uncharacterized caspase-like protein
MKKKLFIVLILLVFMFLSVSIISSQRYDSIVVKNIGNEKEDIEYRKERLALMVGVDKYKNQKDLTYAVKDTNDLGNVLYENSVFTVEKLSNSTKSEVDAKIEEVIKRVKSGDIKTLLFFFSGRGYHEGEVSYLATTEVDTKDLSNTAVSMDEIIIKFEQLLSEFPELKIIVLVDVGRRLVGPKPPAPKDMSWDSGRGMCVLYSTTEFTYAFESHNLKNGVYTYYLIEALKGAAEQDKDVNSEGYGYISFNEASEYVIKQVEEWCKKINTVEEYGEAGDQYPYSRTDWAKGEFYLSEY